MNPNTPDTPTTPPAPEQEGVPTQPTQTPQDAPQSPDFASPSPAPSSDPEPTPIQSSAPLAEPVAPAPVSPVGSQEAAPTPAQTNLTPSGPNKNKKAIIIASIIAGVVLLVAAGLIAFFALTTVSKQDYANAATKFNEVTRANTSLNNDVTSLNSDLQGTDEEFNKAISDAQAAIATLETQNKELGDMKAVRVGEGKEHYDAFNAKLKAYLEYGNGLISSVKNVRPALVACEGISNASTTSERATAIRACADSYNEVGEIPNAEFKTFIDTLKTEYDKYATAYEGMAAISDPYGDQYDQYRSLRDQIYDIQDTITEASKTFATAISARDDELSVKDSAETLADYLNEQQRK